MAQDPTEDVGALLFRDVIKSLRKGLKGHDYEPEKHQYRASRLPGCPRRLVLNKQPSVYLDEDKIPAPHPEALPFPDELYELGALMMGSLIHEAIQKALTDYGTLSARVSLEEEISLRFGEIEIVGHADLVLRDKEGEPQLVVDLKSTAQIPTEPYESHTQQLSLYQGALRKIPGAILYVEKNNFRMLWHSVPWEQVEISFAELLAKAGIVHGHVMAQTIPEIPPRYSPGSFPCSYCEWLSPCYELAAGAKKNLGR